MTYPPGTRVRVTFEGVVDTDDYAKVGNAGVGYCLASANWLAANPDKVTVLLDEPADGGVVLDRDGDAWQRHDDVWRLAGSMAAESRRHWTYLTENYGPLTVIHAGGE